MPTKYTIEDTPAQSKYTIEDGTTPPKPEGFLESLGHTFGIGREEGEARAKELKEHPIRSLGKALIGPTGQLVEGAYSGFMRTTDEAGQAVDAVIKDKNPYGAVEHAAYAVPFVGAGIKRGVEQLGPHELINRAELGTALGTAIQTAPMVVDAARPITQPIADAPGALVRKVGGTSPKLLKDLVDKTRRENEGIRTTNTKQAQQHAEDVQDALHEQEGTELLHRRDQQAADEENARLEREHGQAVQLVDAENNAKMDAHQNQLQTVIAENARRQRDYAEAKTKTENLKKAAQQQETYKGRTARQVQQYGSRLLNRIRDIQDKWKDSTALQKSNGYKPTGILDKAYAQIRSATAGETALPSEAADAVRRAEAKITGSRENVKIFRDILSRNPESDPEFVMLEEAGGKTRIPKGHPLYDVLNDAGKEGTRALGFRDLQGYYSELGRALSKGNLPDDVYMSLRGLQSDIGAMMQKMADNRGVGGLLRRTQAQYRDYMQTFREPTGPNHSGSPIANALQAKDPAYAVEPLMKPESTARVRNALTRFDPSAVGGTASLYDMLLVSNRVFEGIEPIKVPKMPAAPDLKETPQSPTLKPRPAAPTLKTVEPPNRPTFPDRPEETPVQRIGQAEVESAKRESAAKRSQQISHRGSWVATWPLFHLVGSIMRGEIPSVAGVAAESAGTLASVHALTTVLGWPNVVEFLTAATPRDVAQIPADLRGDFPRIVMEAHKRGIKVSPALTRAFIVGPALAHSQAGKSKMDFAK